MVGGITMGPGTNSTWDSEANGLVADTAYPYQGQQYSFTSVPSVVQQLNGPNSSAIATYAAILYAMSSTNGPIDIVAYSGGAGAFAAAYQMLTPTQKSDIGQIVYIAPGSSGATLPVSTGQTYTYTGPGLQNIVAGLGTTSVGVVTPTNCYHQQLSCWFAAAAGPLATVAADGTCNDPQSFTRSQAIGWLNAAAAASQQQQVASTLQYFQNYFPGLADPAGAASSFLDWVDSIPVGGYGEQVWSTIAFDWP